MTGFTTTGAKVSNFVVSLPGSCMTWKKHPNLYKCFAWCCFTEHLTSQYYSLQSANWRLFPTHVNKYCKTHKLRISSWRNTESILPLNANKALKYSTVIRLIWWLAFNFPLPAHRYRICDNTYCYDLHAIANNFEETRPWQFNVELNCHYSFLLGRNHEPQCRVFTDCLLIKFSVERKPVC